MLDTWYLHIPSEVNWISEKIQNSFDSHPENALHFSGPLCLSYYRSQWIQGAPRYVSAIFKHAAQTSKPQDIEEQHNNSKEVQALDCDKKKWAR